MRPRSSLIRIILPAVVFVFSATPSKACFLCDLAEGVGVVGAVVFGAPIVGAVAVGGAVANEFANTPDADPNNVFCRRYASTAVASVQKGRDNACGFPDAGRFNGNYQAHLDFCTWTSDKNFVNSEWQKRDRAVAACQSCWPEARAGVQRGRDFRRFHCHVVNAWALPPDDPAWSPDPYVHLRNCIGPDGNTSASLTRANKFASAPRSAPPRGLGIISMAHAMGLSVVGRYESPQEAIDNCKITYLPRDVQACEQYAATAVADANNFNKYNCDTNASLTPRWSTDQDGHFAWCIWPGNAQWKDGEQQARKGALQACPAAQAAAAAAAAGAASGKTSTRRISNPNSSGASMNAGNTPSGAVLGKGRGTSKVKLGSSSGSDKIKANPSDGCDAMCRLSGVGSSQPVAPSNPRLGGGNSSGAYMSSSGQRAPAPGAPVPSGGAAGNSSGAYLSSSGGPVTRPSLPSSGLKSEDQIMRLNRPIARDAIAPPPPKWNPGDPK